MYVTFSSPICSAANRHGLDSDLVSSSTRVDLCITAMRSVPRSYARGTLTVTYNRPIYVTGTLGRGGDRHLLLADGDLHLRFLDFSFPT